MTGRRARTVRSDEAAGHRAAARHDRAGDDPRRRWAPVDSASSLAVLVGGALAAGGANTMNCWIERDRDQLMKRTHHRPLPAGASSRCTRSGVRARARGRRLRLCSRRRPTCSRRRSRWARCSSTSSCTRSGSSRGARRTSSSAAPPARCPVLVGLGRGHRQLARPAWVLFADRVLLDAAPLLGARAALPRRLRRGRHPDAAGREGRRGATRQILVYSVVVVVAHRRARAGRRPRPAVPRRRARARRCAPGRSGTPAARPRAGRSASSSSRTPTSRRSSSPLPPTSSSAPSDLRAAASASAGLPSRSAVLGVLVVLGIASWAVTSASDDEATTGDGSATDDALGASGPWPPR